MTFPILGPWPELETSMDNSQVLAFKQALTKEFAIIQGPPGIEEGERGILLSAHIYVALQVLERHLLV